MSDLTKDMNKTSREEKIIFNLMFHGCQTITSSQAREILTAIKHGKVSGLYLSQVEESNNE